MKLAIFDMDGTLYNTNDVNYYAYNEALSKYNINLDYHFFCQYCNGRSYKVFLPQIVENQGIIEEIHNNKKTLYSKYLDKVKLNEHLFNIINLIKKEYKIALVTTASRKNTLDILEYTNKINLFDIILTADEITNPKPDPEGFLLAMNKINALPEETIIFEDSDVGIEAAVNTKATVFKINNF